MVETKHTDVLAAFDMLLDELASEIAHVNHGGARAFQAADYDGARQTLERAKQMTALRAQMADWRAEWESLLTDPTTQPVHTVMEITSARRLAIPAVPLIPSEPNDRLEAKKQEPIHKPNAIGAGRRNLGRVAPGVRTSKYAYCRPILQSLIELGGRAEVRDVLARVERAMHHVLVEADYEPLASNPNMLHWDNNAQWARDYMVRDGRLKKGSPHGIWEISEAGQAYVANRHNGTT
jgi:restriction system protein